MPSALLKIRLCDKFKIVKISNATSKLRRPVYMRNQDCVDPIVFCIKKDTRLRLTTQPQGSAKKSANLKTAEKRHTL